MISYGISCCPRHKRDAQEWESTTGFGTNDAQPAAFQDHAIHQIRIIWHRIPTFRGVTTLPIG